MNNIEDKMATPKKLIYDLKLRNDKRVERRRKYEEGLVKFAIENKIMDL